MAGSEEGVPSGVTRVAHALGRRQQPGGVEALVGGPGLHRSRGAQHDGSNNLNYARQQLALDAGVAVVGVTNSHDPNSTRSNDAMVAITQKLWDYYKANAN